MKATRNNVLDGFEVSSAPNQWVLGTFDRNLTVYDQQVRALNLAYALKHANVIPTKLPLAVIGAGIAGITFAAGCIWLNQKVVLIEKQPVPCHLQRGCDIRWLHPHIYHWPKVGSEQPYAGLPLLSWAEGTASEVARQLMIQWEWLAKSATNGGLLEEIYGSQYRFISSDKKSLEVNGFSNGKAYQRRLDVAGVVFAVGFGVEIGHDLLKAHSYWENDSFNQLKPNHPLSKEISWLVSGMGDGSLIDLQRLCIETFRQGRVVEELFKDQKLLVDVLRKMVNKTDSVTLDDFDTLGNSNEFDKIDGKLRNRKRKDTIVTLNWRATDFKDAFNKSRASFLNKLILHRLYSIDAFKYIGGEIWDIKLHDNQDSKCYRLMFVDIANHSATYHEFDNAVLRHGTKRRVWLEQAGYRSCEELETSVQSITQPCMPNWDPGWWSLNSNKQLLQTKGKVGYPPREHVSPVTEAIATTFVRTVAGLIDKDAGENKKYRITLHRVVPMNGTLRIQQIANYAGTRPDLVPGLADVTKENESSAMQLGTVGRIFNVNHLTIGLCVRDSCPCLLRSKRAKDLLADMKSLSIHGANARPMENTVRSVLTIPFYTAKVLPDNKLLVNLVLYLDSDDSAFFTADLMGYLYSACCAFKQHLDNIASQQDSSYRIIDWDWSDSISTLASAMNSQTVNLKTFVLDAKDYGDFYTEDGMLQTENLKFEDVGAVDIVPRIM